MSPASLAPPTSASARHAHCSFGLIVTGKGERDFLPQLFGVLMLAAGCSFKVLAFTGQRGAITSPRKQLRMVGTGKTIPDRDAAEIGLPARRHLLAAPHHFVLLIDDLESNRRLQIGEIFARYRAALTTLCPQVGDRAGVHFFANMLEAYYFAHSAAVHQALGRLVLPGDWLGDVEEIEHPKNRLKELHPGFDERAAGAKIVPLLDLRHILANPATCAFLRSLMAWCVKQLRAHGQIYDEALPGWFQLPTGKRAELTDGQ